jgi:hypothetical protein
MEKQELIELKEELQNLDFVEWNTDIKLQAIIILELREIRKLLEK